MLGIPGVGEVEDGYNERVLLVLFYYCSNWFDRVSGGVDSG